MAKLFTSISSYSARISFPIFAMETVTVLEANQVYGNFYTSKKFKELLEAEKNDIVEPGVGFECLNKKQQFVIKYVRHFLEKPDAEQRDKPLQLAVFGKAGTGKSVVLSHLKKLLQVKARDHPSFKFQILSFTGMASHNVGGEFLVACFYWNAYKCAKIH